MEKIQYLSRVGAPFKEEDTEKIGEFVFNKCKGLDTPKILDIVKKNKNHIIANYIEWDDKIASEKYRLQQIRNIINHIEIKVTVIEPDGERKINCNIRAFSSVNDGDKKIYIPFNEIMENEEYRKQMVSKFWVELQNLEVKYRIYSELTPVFVEIDKIKQNKKDGATFNY